ncbi:hypothetical protein E2C01_047331 [Portunus trituberculatus]|uniref:Uncharacterized protein n=1 Tax=Portunus trituberculatus TaxID=210409 RepID=A0A5B7G062_PORTR|nr:hypothetical protein [Portunus trituberculatus]
MGFLTPHRYFTSPWSLLAATYSAGDITQRPCIPPHPSLPAHLVRRFALGEHRDADVGHEALAVPDLLLDLGGDLEGHEVARLGVATLRPHVAAAHEVLVLHVDHAPRPADVVDVGAVEAVIKGAALLLGEACGARGPVEHCGVRVDGAEDLHVPAVRGGAAVVQLHTLHLLQRHDGVHVVRRLLAPSLDEVHEHVMGSGAVNEAVDVVPRLARAAATCQGREHAVTEVVLVFAHQRLEQRVAGVVVAAARQVQAAHVGHHLPATRRFLDGRVRDDTLLVVRVAQRGEMCLGGEHVLAVAVARRQHHHYGRAAEEVGGLLVLSAHGALLLQVVGGQLVPQQQAHTHSLISLLFEHLAQGARVVALLAQQGDLGAHAPSHDVDELCGAHERGVHVAPCAARVVELSLGCVQGAGQLGAVGVLVKAHHVVLAQWEETLRDLV